MVGELICCLGPRLEDHLTGGRKRRHCAGLTSSPIATLEVQYTSVQDRPARLRIYRNDSANESRPALPRVVHQGAVFGCPANAVFTKCRKRFQIFRNASKKSTHNHKIQAKNGVPFITIFRLLIFL